MEDCIFCKIIKGEIQSKKVFEDDFVYAFYDINPQAKIHVIIVPKHHLESVNSIDETNSLLISKLFEKIPEIAKILGVKENGYRIITNIGENAGQTVKHLHFHLLAGEFLGEKLV